MRPYYKLICPGDKECHTQGVINNGLLPKWNYISNISRLSAGKADKQRKLLALFLGSRKSARYARVPWCLSVCLDLVS